MPLTGLAGVLAATYLFLKIRLFLKFARVI